MEVIEKLQKMLEDIKQKVENSGESSQKIVETCTALEHRINEIEKFQKDLEAKIAATRIPGVADETKKQKFSIFKVIYGVVTGDWKNAGFEREVMEAAREKAMSTGTGSAGGYIVPAEQITDIIEMLYANSVVIQSGASVMSNLSGSPVEMPKQTGGATAYWVAENSAITASDLTLGQLTMTPKQVAALVKLSNRLIKLSNPSAEALVRTDIAIALSLAIDLAALRGTGSSNQPTGIANTSGINTVAIGTNGGTPTFDHLLDMEGTLEDTNALRGTLGYVMHPKVKRVLKKTKVAQYSGQTDGQYVILPMSDQNLRDIIGYNFQTTTQIPTNLTKGSGTNLSEIYFGNWRELLIGNWGGLEIATSNVAGDSSGGAFSSNQTWIRAIQEVDIAVRHAASFCLINDAATS